MSYTVHSKNTVCTQYSDGDVGGGGGGVSGLAV